MRITVTSYHEAYKALNGKKEKKIGHETWLVDLGYGEIAVKHHNTYIIIYAKNGFYRLKINDWYTVTTKERLNRLTPFSIWGSNRNAQWEISTGIDSAVFEDGMIIPPDWSLQAHKQQIFEANMIRNSRQMKGGRW